MNNWEESAVLRRDEDSGALFWEIQSPGNKEYTRLDDGENIILNPIYYTLGTTVTIKHVED